MSHMPKAPSLTQRLIAGISFKIEMKLTSITDPSARPPMSSGVVFLKFVRSMHVTRSSFLSFQSN